jgi:hypothetical protein
MQSQYVYKVFLFADHMIYHSGIPPYSSYFISHNLTVLSWHIFRKHQVSLPDHALFHIRYSKTEVNVLIPRWLGLAPLFSSRSLHRALRLVPTIKSFSFYGGDTHTNTQTARRSHTRTFIFFKYGVRLKLLLFCFLLLCGLFCCGRNEEHPQYFMKLAPYFSSKQ